jgi:small glutamine-rich tetratricopeptide repeat-containing protein alpha
MEAYKTGIDADGNGGSKALRDGYKATKEKVDKEEEVSNKTAPGVPGGFGGLEKLLGGMGGMGGPDGAAPDMPFDINQLDINQLLNNKGLLEAAMKSPIVKSILGGDGGAPDMNKISQFLAMCVLTISFLRYIC